MLFALPARAEEPGAPPKGAVEVEEWMEHRTWLTAFGGATLAFPTESVGGEPAATEVAPAFGLDLSFRLSQLFGIGVYGEYSFSPLHEMLIGPAVYLFPWRGLFIELAPSLGIDKENLLFFVGRGAVGYEFDLTPQLLLGLYAALDYGRGGLAFVPGVTFGYGF
jgi:hypothetical protein